MTYLFSYKPRQIQYLIQYNIYHHLVIRETLKNLGKYFHNQFTGLNRQLQPVIKIMNELAKEENEEKNN